MIEISSQVKCPMASLEDLFACVKRKYDVDEKYDYHLKTSMVYFKDAEPEIDSIVLIDDKGTPRKIASGEWDRIKDFFLRFCQ